MPGSETQSHSFGFIVITYIFSRVALEIIGLLSLFYFPPASSIGPARDLRYHKPQKSYFEIWARWDSEWYLLIAEKGYSSYEAFRNYGGGRYLKQETSKFLPAYPMGIRTVSYFLRNSVLSGIILSNLCAILFLYYLYRIASGLGDENRAFHSAFSFIVFPTSFFLNAVYPESLFLAAVTAAFYYLERKKLWPALLACAVTMITRPQGILALPALAWLAYSRMPEKKFQAMVGVLLASAIPIVVYTLFIQDTLGSFRWIAASQDYWRGKIHYPLYALVRFFQSDIAIHGQHNSLIDFCFAMLNLAALIYSVRRIPGPYYLYSIIVVMFPLFSTLFSFPRLCLVNFPLFLILGSFSGRWAFSFRILSAMLLAFFMAAFANWYWVA